MNRKDWLLLIVSLAKDNVLSPAQLQKTLFLFKENKPSSVGADFYEFVPYNYGPFCKDIYSDAQDLINEGLIKHFRPLNETWEGYTITDAGKKQINLLKIPKDDRQYLQNIVDWIKSLSFRELLSVIYKKYPQYKINSVFQEL